MYDLYPASRYSRLALVLLAALTPAAQASWLVSIGNGTSSAVTFTVSCGNQSQTVPAGGWWANVNVSSCACITATASDGGSLPDVCWYTGSGGPWNYNAPQTTYYITYTGSAAPTEWTMTTTYSNNSDFDRTVEVDIDGDGEVDEKRTLRPGQTWTQTWTRDAAPTAEGLITVSGPGGADSGPYFAFDSIPTSDWQNNGGGGGGTGLSTAGIGTGANQTTDTKSKTTPSIDFAAPSGSASESSLKTGLSSLRDAVTESGQSQSGLLGDIKEKLKSLATAPSTNGAKTAVATATNTVGAQARSTIEGATASTMPSVATGLTAPAAPTPSGPDPWIISVPGLITSLDVAPWRHPEFTGAFAFVWHLQTWVILALFGWACWYFVDEARRMVVFVPAQPSSNVGGAVPGVSLAVTLAMAIAAGLTIAGTIAAVWGVVVAAFPSLAAFSQGPFGVTSPGPVIMSLQLLYALVPVGLLFTCGAALVVVRLTSDTLATLASILIRSMST